MAWKIIMKILYHFYIWQFLEALLSMKGLSLNQYTKWQNYENETIQIYFYSFKLNL